MSNIYQGDDNAEMVSVQAHPHVWSKLAHLCLKAARILRQKKHKEQRDYRICPSCHEKHLKSSANDELREEGKFCKWKLFVQQWKEIAKLLVKDTNTQSKELRTLLKDPDFIMEHLDLKEVEKAWEAQGKDRSLLSGLYLLEIPTGMFDSVVADYEKGDSNEGH